MHAVENIRPDITVYTGRYIYINDQLYRPYRMQYEKLKSLFNEFIKHTGKRKPIYFTNDFPNDFPEYRYGFYKKVDMQSPPGSSDKVILKPEYISLLKYWGEKFHFTNAWDIMHYNLLLEDFCELVLNVRYSSATEEIKMPENSFACENYQGTLKKLEFAVNRVEFTPAKLKQLLEEADALRVNAFTKRERAELEQYRAIYHLRKNEIKGAVVSLEKSISIWPHPDNPSKILLSAIILEYPDL